MSLQLRISIQVALLAAFNAILDRRQQDHQEETGSLQQGMPALCQQKTPALQQKRSSTRSPRRLGTASRMRVERKTTITAIRECSYSSNRSFGCSVRNRVVKMRLSSDSVTPRS